MARDPDREQARGATARNVVAPDEEPTGSQPAHDQIAQRADELFLARGGALGHDLEDRLRAERELRSSEGTDTHE